MIDYSALPIVKGGHSRIIKAMDDKPPDSDVKAYLAAIGRKGGEKKSARKRRANQAKIIKFWAEVNAGIREKPKSGRKKKVAPETPGRE